MLTPPTDLACCTSILPWGVPFIFWMLETIWRTELSLELVWIHEKIFAFRRDSNPGPHPRSKLIDDLDRSTTMADYAKPSNNQIYRRFFICSRDSLNLLKLKVIDECAPRTSFKVRNCHKFGISDITKALIKDRDCARNNIKLKSPAEKLIQQAVYKKLRNRVISEIIVTSNESIA